MKAQFHAFAAAALAAGVTIALTGTASAQLAPGYSGQSGVQYMGNEEVWWSLRQLGGCLARTRPRASETFLATQPGTPAEAAASRALLGTNTSCLQPNSRLSVTRDLLRGVVAEGLYTRTVTAPPPALATAPDDVPAIGRDGKELRIPILVSFARCYVAMRPNEVHNLLTTTRLGTRAEHEAIGTMAADFGQCLRAGARVNLQAPVVRIVLAEAIYHRARAAGAAAPQGRR